MKIIDKYIQKDFFNNKSLIEFGCGNGHNGNEFLKRGCSEILCTDARPEHLEIGKKLFPSTSFQVFDCETDRLEKNFDIALHWGTLYHLKTIDEHLQNVCSYVQYLFLETECCDSGSSILIPITEKDTHGGDQAKSGIGCRPSPSYVENLLTIFGFQYFCVNDADLNCLYYSYNWTPKNTNSYIINKTILRKFWICWKNECESPIKVSNSE